MFSRVDKLHILIGILLCVVIGFVLHAQQEARPAAYFHLKSPRQILTEPQSWEGTQAPHTLSVLEMNREGFRYWGWYGLNEGKGIGLARSNDLVNWTKYEQNPLWTNARWPSVVAHADSKHADLLYFAITRNYDTPTSYVVLASSADGIHLTEEKVLVQAVPNQRNQNPNLFRDPRSGRFYLTFYRGNDRDDFAIISKSADAVIDLDRAPEKILLRSPTTIAAPTLLYAERTAQKKNGIYYLATETYPNRYANTPESEWQVSVYASDTPDGDFEPVEGNPVMRKQRACLFQHVFDGKFYGYDCHVDGDKWTMEEVEADWPSE
jgi:hypothetical protein